MWAPRRLSAGSGVSTFGGKPPCSVLASHQRYESLDHFVDLLHDDRETLKLCCLVSKSWIPCLQKHLFACVEFEPEVYDKRKKRFPDPMNSPGYHIHTLKVRDGLKGAEWGSHSWIQAFSRVQRMIANYSTISSDGVDNPFSAPASQQLPSSLSVFLPQPFHTPRSLVLSSPSPSSRN